MSTPGERSARNFTLHRHVDAAAYRQDFAGQNTNAPARRRTQEAIMNQLVYLVGLVVVVIAVLSFFGLR